MAAPAPAPGPGPGPSSSSTSVSSPAGGGPRPPYRSRFGDTTLTKVFVGGLAWETPSEGLRQHFERYGDILEAVVISDRLTGRSKGYGFVTFREPEAALRAVQDPNPVIAGRRANCNIASLGPPRPRGTASIVGAHLQVPPPPTQLPAPPFYPRAPPQMVAQHGGPAMIYPPSQFGYYWYPPDFQYQQALAANPQVLQNYYAQIYGLASPAAAPPFHPYVGFLPSPGPAPAPRAVLPPPAPAMQVAGQALVHHPTPPAMQFAGQALVHHHPTPSPQQQVQHQGQFVLPTVPSLPQNFRLELPPRPAVSSLPPPSTTDLQSPPDQAATAAGATTSASSGAPGGA